MKFHKVLSVALPVCYMLHLFFIGSEYHWLFRALASLAIGSSVHQLWTLRNKSNE